MLNHIVCNCIRHSMYSLGFNENAEKSYSELTSMPD